MTVGSINSNPDEAGADQPVALKACEERGWTGIERMYPPTDWLGVSPKVVSLRGKAWNQDPDAGPWLDQPGAQDRIAHMHKEGKIDDQQEQALRQWETEGYTILRGVLDPKMVEDYAKDLDDLWTDGVHRPGLQIMSLHIPGRQSGPVDHAELLTWPLETRIDLRDNQIWRIHYHHPNSRSGFDITTAAPIVDMARLILGEETSLINSIGFQRGSQVGLHQDICAYHIHPTNRLVGVWVACEDVHEDAGPLTVYPRTHKVPIWSGWNNYPQTNLRTCTLGTRDAQNSYLEQHIAGIEPRPLVIEKGDVIFQHPLQIHNGGKIKDRSHTRKSLVLHYSVPGGDRMNEVVGPFNW